jgi:TrpR family trp operon transcriptional repressor
MKIDDPRVAENIDELSGLLSELADVNTVRRLFRDLFTPAESADIASRWALIKQLDAKVTQRNIAKELGLSLCKITRGARELKRADSSFHTLLSMSKR